MAMRSKQFLKGAGVACALGGLMVGAQAQTQGPGALSGQVTSAEEGPMEGVLVSARKDGSNITTTVVSDEKGQYSFARDRLEPGHYRISIRAADYMLDGARQVDVTETGSRADLRLVKSKDLANQLANAEWLMSAPGPDNLKGNLTNCVTCHTLQRVFTSTHAPQEFKDLFTRMGTYSPGTQPLHIQPLLPGPRGNRSPMPRPKGEATKVVITEYDLPRKDAQPHDVIVDQDGTVWYSDFSHQFVGTLDPKTGKATDIPIPVLKADEPKGGLDLEFDPGQKNVWLAMMYQAGIAKIDRKTHEVKIYPFPKA